MSTTRRDADATGANERRATVQSLERGLDVLESISAANRELGITDLSHRLGLAKGSVARLVATLARRNFLTRNPKTAKYRIGVRTWEIGYAVVAQLDVREVAHSVMEQLHAVTQETVHLTVLSEEGYAVFLDKLDSTKAIRPNVRLGERVPPHCVANGKVLLAYRPDAEVRKILDRGLPRFTSTTVTGLRDVLRILTEVRRQGYSVNRGEWRADVSGVAAPIRDFTGAVVAALGISVPTARMTRDVTRELVLLVVKAAEEISLTLGRQREAGEPIAREDHPASGRLVTSTRRRSRTVD